MHTGSLTLDILLGGYRKGIYLLYGEESSGKTLIGLKALSLHPEATVYVDTTGDGTSLLSMWDADKKVVYIESTSVHSLQKAVPHLPPQSMMVIDTISRLPTGEDHKPITDDSYCYFKRAEEVGAFIENVRHAVSMRDIILIVTSDMRTSGNRIVPSFPHLFANDTRIYCKRRQQDIDIEIAHPSFVSSKKGIVRVYRDPPYIDIDCVREMVDWCLAFGVLTKNGSHYYHKDSHIGAGIDSAILWAESMYEQLIPLFTGASNER